MSERSFTFHEIHGYIASVYLMETPEGLFLMDGGCRGDVKRIETYIKEKLNRPMSDLRLLFVSHMHPDHAGAAPILRRKYGIPIAAHYQVDRWYRGVRGWLQQRVDRSLAQYSARKNGRSRESVAYRRKVKPDIGLKDGAALPIFPGWEVLSVPGHTLYDMVLLNRQSRILYAADIVLHRNEKYMLPFPVPFPELMAESLDRLAMLDVDTLLLAHGGIREHLDAQWLFNQVKDNIGKNGNVMFKWLTPLCSIAPDIAKHK